MYKNILVATDGSEKSKIATEYAAISADKWGARLTILSVASLPLEMKPDVNGFSADYCKDYEKIIMAYHLSVLENAKKAVLKTHPELEIATQVKKGDTVSSILEASIGLDADLVLIGGNGLGGEKTMLGSISNQIVNQCTKQVLVVK